MTTARRAAIITHRADASAVRRAPIKLQDNAVAKPRVAQRVTNNEAGTRRVKAGAASRRPKQVSR